MELFEGDEEKIKEMERLIAGDMGFAGVVPVSGQTYSRKVDAYFLGGAVWHCPERHEVCQ